MIVIRYFPCRYSERGRAISILPKSRLDLLSDKNRALTFLELVRFLRERDYVKANFWIACLAHTTADPSATNHETITQLIDYIYAEETEKYKTPAGNYPEVLELHAVAIHPVGQKIFNTYADKYSVPEKDDLQSTLEKIMLYGIEGSRNLAHIGFDLVRVSMRYADDKDESALPIIFANMSRLAAWGICRTLREFAAN